MEKIGNYDLIRSSENELGRGSFSIVYLATYVGLDNKYIKNNTKVAIKVIKTNNLTKKATEILQDEVNIMELIKDNPHPNIVGCYDVIRKEKELYIILEYCDSGDLRGILKKPIKEKYAQFYFCQLANGLKYLDNQCIIHRDIKPKNILLTDKRRVLKIADFGFAKKHQEQSLHETICGSPLYMAPEIIDNKMYNNQTDLWSIGMILYEMLYGNHPFQNCRTIPELKDTVSKTIIEIPPSDTKNKDVSKSCIQLLQKLLEKKVNDRISWFDFFENQWIKQYKCDEMMSQDNKNNEYEKQLQSASLGSFDNDHIDKLSSYQKPNCSPPTQNETHIIKMSKIDTVTIIDDFYDTIEHSNPVNIDKYNRTIPRKRETYSPEDCIFQMDIDDTSPTKKIIVRKVIEKSSILDDADNNYDIVESI